MQRLTEPVPVNHDEPQVQKRINAPKIVTSHRPLPPLPESRYPMFKKYVRRNPTFLIALLVLFLLFGSILFFTNDKIFRVERDWLRSIAQTQLESGREIIQVFFSSVQQDLLFLASLFSTTTSLPGTGQGTSSLDELQKIFHGFACLYPQYHEIRLLDASGKETLRIENRKDGQTVIVPESELHDQRDSAWFRRLVRLDPTQPVASSFGWDMEPESGDPTLFVLRFGVPLLDDENRRNGLLVLDLFLSNVLELLPRDMFLQTPEGKVITLQADNTISVVDSQGSSTQGEGFGNAWDHSIVHSIHVEFLPGRPFVLGVRQSYPFLKNLLNKILILSILALSLFTLLLTFLAYRMMRESRNLVEAQKAVIFSLVNLAEGRDPVTGHHLERTRDYSLALAKQLRRHRKYRNRISDDFLEDLHEAALLHDIGKVAVRDDILLKEGHLADEEYDRMKEHVRVGEQILNGILERFKTETTFFRMAKNICAYHQEKYNGTGYLLGLREEQIPLEARIFALADAYDAIRSKRPYKDSLSHEEAIARIQEGRGTHFDPEVVEAFLQCEKEFLRISLAYGDGTTSRPAASAPRL
jgi:HD-GYP domain-containing protein (c-di-GMP phosphodiesterase class II)